MEDGICVNLIGFLQEFPKLKNLSINHTSNWNTGVDPDFGFFGTIMNLKNLFHSKISANMDLSETISNGLLENIKALERSGDLGNQFHQLKSLSLEIPKLTAPCIKHIISFINPNKSKHVTINMNPYNWSELNFDYRRPVGNDNNVDLKSTLTDCLSNIENVSIFFGQCTSNIRSNGKSIYCASSYSN